MRHKDKKNKTGCITVRDKMGLFKIISMLNGNIFMDTRKMQFKLLRVAYNKIFKQSIVYIDYKYKLYLSNYWLSVFTGAEACFTCYRLDRFLLRLYVLYLKGNFEQMQYLGELFNGKAHYIKNYTG